LSVLFLLSCFCSIVSPVSAVLFLFYCLSFLCSIAENRTDTGQTIEQKQERQYNRKRTENRTERGQTIEQKKDRQYVSPVSVLLSVLFLLYCLPCFFSIVCPFSALLSVLFM
jgi:hypothetical protein